MEIKLCNCAGCYAEIMGENTTAASALLSEEERKTLPPPIAGRVKGRPYCKTCWRVLRKEAKRGKGDTA